MVMAVVGVVVKVCPSDVFTRDRRMGSSLSRLRSADAGGN